MENSKYLILYNKLIEHDRKRQNFIESKVFHVHHIVPKCIGGSNDDSNLIKLTVKHHIIAHMLLSKAYPENDKLLFAAVMMTSIKDENGNLHRVSVKIAAEISEKYSLGQRGKILSEETKNKMSKSRLGHKTSDETKQKISISEKGKEVSRETRLKSVGKEFSEERKKKLSEISSRIRSDEDRKKKLSDKLKSRGDKNNTTGYLVIVDDATTYQSQKEAASSLNISVDTLKRWAQNPDTSPHKIDIQKVTSSYKIQGPDGTIYNSLYECSKLLKRTKRAIRNWILNYPELGYKIINDFIPRVD